MQKPGFALAFFPLHLHYQSNHLDDHQICLALASKRQNLPSFCFVQVGSLPTWTISFDLCLFLRLFVVSAILTMMERIEGQIVSIAVEPVQNVLSPWYQQWHVANLYHY